MFSIHSVSSDRELVFHHRKGEYFFVELKDSNLSVITEVWDGMESSNGLCELFQELSDFKTPWQGERVWESLEGEFGISATCTLLGHVIFSVKMAGQLGGVEEWNVQAALETELGQLDKIARNIRVFFKN